MQLATILVATALLSLPVRAIAAQNDCEAARCAVQDAINQRCSCDDATNHGRYVSCVAHVVKQLSKDGTIPTNCKGKIKRCAARSTCGKPDAVTCTFTTLGTCDVATGLCVEPADVPCATNADCVIDSRCRTKSSAERCTERGGVPGEGTCCAACAAPAP